MRLLETTMPIEHDLPTHFPEETSLARALELAADSRPDHAAILQGPLRISYQELRDRAQAQALLLREQGHAPGDRGGLLRRKNIGGVTAFMAGCGVSFAAGAASGPDPDWIDTRRGRCASGPSFPGRGPGVFVPRRTPRTVGPSRGRRVPQPDLWHHGPAQGRGRNESQHILEQPRRRAGHGPRPRRRPAVHVPVLRAHPRDCGEAGVPGRDHDSAGFCVPAHPGPGHCRSPGHVPHGRGLNLRNPGSADGRQA